MINLDCDRTKEWDGLAKVKAFLVAFIIGFVAVTGLVCIGLIGWLLCR